VSSCFPRKGVDVLLAAWAKAFTRRDPVRLVIKTFPNPHNTVEADVAALRAAHPDAAPIEIVNRDLDGDALARLFEDAAAVVLPSRGEGYNLPALEAMLAGVPLIVTAHGGHVDFCGRDEARLIDFSFARSGSHVAGGQSLWLEPDADDLAQAMREIVDPAAQPLIERRRANARSAALDAADRSSWFSRLQTVSRNLLQAEPHAPGQVAWISSWRVRCGIAEYSAKLLDAASSAFRERVIVLSDDRPWLDSTSPIAAKRLYPSSKWGQAERVAAMFEQSPADVIVIQHQDGLMEWDELSRLLEHPAIEAQTSVVVLHNPRGLVGLSEEQRGASIAALAKADRVLVHSLPDMNLLKSFGLYRNTALFPHGTPEPGSLPPARSLARSGPGPVIGCHGFFIHHKGIDKLIRAAALLRRDWPNLRLRLVCARFSPEVSDDAIDHCRRVAAEVGMTDAIEWHLDFLPVDQITELLSECDLIVLPYDQGQDSASGAVRLAIGSLAPVLTTKVNIFDDVAGIVPQVSGNAPNLLANAMQELLADPSRRERVQEAQRDWLAELAWPRRAARLEGLIEGLIAQRRLSDEDGKPL
jgi:glycosyltransferase involved in cell wall biosynthesis